VRLFTRILCLLLIALPLSAQQTGTPAGQPAAPVAHGLEISGTVVHALNGEPVAAAEIAIASTGRRTELESTVSDSSGHFVFQDVAPGKYVLSAKHRGFPRQEFEGHGQFSTAIAVGPGKNSANLVFRLKPEASISGRITDEQDDPVRSASVMLFARNVEAGERAINLRSRSLTDDQGGYHFGHLPAGDYYICVSAKPWYASPESSAGRATGANSELDVAYPTTYYRQAVEPEQANAIRLSWGDRVAADIMLRAVPALHLRLISQEPGSMAGIDEAMLKQTLLGGTEVYMESQTVNIGPNAVEISGIAPGRYDLGVVAGKEKDGVGTSTARHQTVSITASGSLDASGGSELAAISGTLVFESPPAPPLDSISVEFRHRESGQNFEVSLSAQAEFDLTEVRPGHYDVVLLNSAGAVLKSIAAAGAKVTGKSIEIAGNSRVRLTLIASQETGRVEGLVLRDSKPVSGAMVVLVPRDPANNWSMFRRDQSDSDGSFELPAVTPGSYTLVAIENGWDLEWANPAALEPYLSQGQPVDVASGVRLALNVKCATLHTAGDKALAPK
jgi:hypothetical protein